MSLNKSRKRLIKKYHEMFNSHPIDIKISTDGGKTFSDMGNIPCAGVICSGNISIKKLEAKRPIVVYKADNQGAEIKGRILQKEKIGDMYTVTVQNYGIFVVTQTNYESLKIGDEVRL